MNFFLRPLLAVAFVLALTARARASSNADRYAKMYPSRVQSRKALVQGTYKSGEAVSKKMYFEPGKRTRVRWRAKPAKGNCVISLFSLFNADLLFSNMPEEQKPVWSEITFETFGGSVNLTEYKQFQTNYLYQDDPTLPKTQRGKQELVNHFLDDTDIPNIYDGKFHNFGIVFQPADFENGKDALIFYWLDGKLIRRERGGNANYLQPPLDIYAGVWITRTRSAWACTNATNPQSRFNFRRPHQSRVVVQNIRVEDRVDNRWVLQDHFSFDSDRDLEDWNLSDWTFDGFDGAFDPSAVSVLPTRMVIDLTTN